MVLYHVTTWKKLKRYMDHGHIIAPVRAWKNIEAAERFSKQTGRRIIFRIKKNDSFTEYEGHNGEALISDERYELSDM